MRWVDIIISLRSDNNPDVLVKGKNGVQKDGLYQNLKADQHSKIEHDLAKYTDWVRECYVANLSLGEYFSIEGAGTGKCSLVWKSLGPFI